MIFFECSILKVRSAERTDEPNSEFLQSRFRRGALPGARTCFTSRFARRSMAHARRHCGQAGLRRGRSRRARFPRHLSRQAAFPARPLPGDVCGAALDHPAICRLLDGGRFQRLLPAQSRRRAERPFDRLRSRHPSRLRQRPSARCRRRRHGRRRHRFDLRHAHAVLRHPARPDERVDDHERRRAAGAGALYRRRRGTRRAAREARRHDPERHPQRIHGAQHLHLPARAVAAHHLRHFRLHLGARCRNSIRFRFPAITCRKPARRRTSSSPIRSPTASNMCAPASRQV